MLFFWTFQWGFVPWLSRMRVHNESLTSFMALPSEKIHDWKDPGILKTGGSLGAGASQEHSTERSPWMGEYSWCQLLQRRICSEGAGLALGSQALHACFFYGTTAIWMQELGKIFIGGACKIVLPKWTEIYLGDTVVAISWRLASTSSKLDPTFDF